MSHDPLRRLLADPPALPVSAGLAQLREALHARGVAVLHAPPGTGKTTLVPPAVALDHDHGRVVVTQPRRIAARAAARRLASLLGEQVGETVGFSVRGERRVGPATRIEVVTSGVLLRRVQRDPELPGVAAVVLDEVHERHLDADLLMALLVDVRDNLRDDLSLVAMSATVESERTAAAISPGSPAPVIGVPGALHPVDVEHVGPPPGVLNTDERGVTPAFLDHVAATVRRALDERQGDALVFVPGVGEIRGLIARLSGLAADVLPLHGQLPPDQQDLALREGPRRRVIVSTAVAESSLTVPGVRLVIDAGLSRQPFTDHRRGLAGLTTVAVSRAGAEQRAGRARREAPGAAYRCWSVADHAHLPAHPAPEIATADLTSFALELALWGTPEAEGLALLDRPPTAALAAARATLVELGAVDADGRASPRGHAIGRIPADPRLARALVDGAEQVGSLRAAEIVALLAEDVRGDVDLTTQLRRMRRGGPGTSSWQQSAKRFAGLVDSRERTSLTDDAAVGTVAALAHPGRIARARDRDPGSYLLASGTGAVLRPGDVASGTEWIVVASAQRRPGERDAVIRSAAPIPADLPAQVAPHLLNESDDVAWRDGRLVARRVRRFGAIELATSPLSDPAPEEVAAALREGLRREGLGMLRWSESAVALRARLDFLHRTLSDPWPDVSDEALVESVETWLGAALGRVRTAADLARVDVTGALRSLLGWAQAARLDELAPEHVTVPTGSRVRVDYSAEQPVVAVRVQEVFGLSETPRLADGRVPVLMHLLSPARRPAAVTDDLARFWANGYRDVRAELRGRYPKHPWPEDPTTAPATNRTKRASGGQ